MAQNTLRLVEERQVDNKSKALDAALSQIERAFGKGSIMRLGANEQVVEIGTVSTGSLGLDIALGVGGLPRGRIIEIYGPESSGKTTLALHTATEPQKKGGICPFFEAEHALDPVYARKLGAALANRRISEPAIGETPLDFCQARGIHHGNVDHLEFVAVNAVSSGCWRLGKRGLGVGPSICQGLARRAFDRFASAAHGHQANDQKGSTHPGSVSIPQSQQTPGFVLWVFWRLGGLNLLCCPVLIPS